MVSTALASDPYRAPETLINKGFYAHFPRPPARVGMIQMARSYAKSNDELVAVLTALRKAGAREAAPLWSAVATRLSGPLRNRAEVNLSRIARVAPPGSLVVVPGKVLGAGAIPHAVTVAAFQFSGSARAKIEASGGKALSIGQLIEKSPKGSNVKIVG